MENIQVTSIIQMKQALKLTPPALEPPLKPTVELAQPAIEPSSTTRAVISMGTAIVALSLAAIFIKLTEMELGPFATVFNRFWLAFAILWLSHQVNAVRSRQNGESDKRLDYSKQDIVLLVVAGIMFWGCLILWAWSLTQTGVANSTILHNLTPLFISFGAWAIFGQQFDRRFLIGLVLAILGGSALGWDDLQVATDNFIGDIAALLSAVFSAANLMLIEKLRDKFTAPMIIMWCCGIGSIISLPLVLLTEERIFPVSWSGWLSVICLAIICQIIGQGLQAYSVKKLSSALVGIFLLLDPVLTAITAWIVFSESLSPFNCFCFGVVLLGIYMAKSSKYAEQLLD